MSKNVIATIFIFFSLFSHFFVSATSTGTNDSFNYYKITLIDELWPEKPFIVTFPFSNTEAVEQLNFYLKDGMIKDPLGNPEFGIVVGKVQRTPATSTHQWNFSIDPNTVGFSDVTRELCDGSFEFVEENLDYWMRKVETFCPWNTREIIQKIERITGDSPETLWSRDKLNINNMNKLNHGFLRS